MSWSFKKWYEKNATAFNENRKKRYKEDEEYRNKVIERNKVLVQRTKEKRLAEKSAIKVRRTKGLRGATVDVVVNGKTTKVKVFTLGALAKTLNKSSRTLYNWERKGLLPDTPFRTPYGVRLYTVEMIEWIKSHMESLGCRDSNAQVKRRMDEHQGCMYIVGNAAGVQEPLRLYRLGTLVKASGKTRETILQWERLGIIPTTPFRYGAVSRRLYTIEMIESLVNALHAVGHVLKGGAKDSFKQLVEGAWAPVMGLHVVSDKVNLMDESETAENETDSEVSTEKDG